MKLAGIKFPVFGLFCMALGGFLLHYRIHPPQNDAFNLIAVLFTLFNALILPAMFFSRKTMPWAYLINATSVVAGVATMTWFSIANWKDPLTLYTILFHSTLADSLILMGKLPLAHAILLAWREFDSEVKA
ncbi:MAG: hypothetical protein A2W80_07585 [Candidatus Riflebacteria bacterium GWC2_50_8]|nr:MAG: hypothetical protein A2W80_07585 [Candidatus Riflebacteria bacterium GWC2_50_8]